MKKRNLYFAYDENMMRPILQEKIGSVITLGYATLDGYVMRFSSIGGRPNVKTPEGKDFVYGYPNIFKSNAIDSGVHGVLFYVTPEQVIKLDKRMGIDKVETNVLHRNKYKLGFTYLDPNPISGLVPLLSTLECMVGGAIDNGLPKEYTEFLTNHPRLEQVKK